MLNLRELEHENEDYVAGYEDGYHAGYEAAKREQWHDLNQDPDDLPEEDRRIIAAVKTRKGYDNIVWNSSRLLSHTAKWCYLPEWDDQA